MRVLIVVLMSVICWSGTVPGSAWSRELPEGLETATGPDGLVQLEQQGKITVRALRGWGRLPSFAVSLARSMRQEAGLDLLGADLVKIREWVTRGEQGDAPFLQFTSELQKLAGFMDRGDHLEWTPVRELESLSPNAPIRREGRLLDREEVAAIRQSVARKEPAPTPSEKKSSKQNPSPELPKAQEVPPPPAPAMTQETVWEWPVPALGRLDFELPENAVKKMDLRLSRDLRHIAWVEEKDEKCRVVLNGVPGRWYDDVGAYSMHFSEQGEQFCFRADIGDGEVAVCNGMQGPLFKDIDPIVLNEENGDTLMVGEIVKGEYRVLLNGLEIHRTDARVKKPILAEDGTAAWVQERKDPSTGRKIEQVVTSTGTTGPGYKTIYSPEFAPDRPELYYIGVKNDGKRYLIRNHEELKPSMGVGFKYEVTDDGVFYSYVAPFDGNVECAVVNGKIGPDYADIWDPPVFNADGTRYIYEAKKEGNAVLVVNDREFTHDYGPVKDIRSLTFSPDGTRWAAVLQLTKEEYALIVEGKEIARRQGSGRKIVFSPDGTSVAWLEKQDKTWRVLLDGQPGPGVKDIFRDEPPQFSPDGKHLVYFHRDKRNKKMFLALWGGEERVHDIIPPLAVFETGKLRYLALDGNRIRSEELMLP
ncbi:MAG TPA: hypothetical protein VJ934_04265 [Desulfomicrobiaceae bacterium]|nr:hypothetical protein [Desulfomicrobiaceae bacterium]